MGTIDQAGRKRREKKKNLPLGEVGRLDYGVSGIPWELAPPDRGCDPVLDVAFGETLSIPQAGAPAVVSARV